ncbi:hypothetical protein GCM10009093_27350 [Brevundimonas terrae]|uniref:DUF4263 domain-containing protein n=1 Tax=Brevundimonas terrae TaxID=363631 RepID=A0ABN0YL84_9CAUL
MVSAFDTLDPEGGAAAFRHAFALLRLSDLVVERAGEDVTVLGPDTPMARMTVPSGTELGDLSARVVFSGLDLEHHGIDAADLEPFRLTDDDLLSIGSTRPGDSPLERRPLWREGGDWIMVSPGAVTTAVRFCLIDAIVASGRGDEMAVSLLATQHDRLTECGFLKDAAVEVVDHGGQPAFDRLEELSPGRFCHVLETMDDFEGWPDRSFGSDRAASRAFEIDFRRSVETARARAQAATDYREGFTLWIAGGWGSGRSVSRSVIERFRDWPVVIISPDEACILGLGEAGRPRDLLRLETLRRMIAADGFELQHPGDWLNLHVFWRENGHDLLPRHLDMTPPVGLQFPLLRQAEIRLDAYKAWNRRTLPHPRFGGIVVSRMERRPWSGELEPIYAAIDAVRRQRLIGAAVIDEAGVIWVEAITKEADRETHFQTWHTALLWAKRVLPVWAARSGQPLSLADLVVSVEAAPTYDWETASEAEIDAAVTVWRERRGVVRIHLARDWHRGLMRTDNRSEVTLAAGLLQACAFSEDGELARDAAIALVRGIVSAGVRHRHASDVVRVVEALGSAGVVQPLRRMSHTAVSVEKYGSVWRVRPRNASREIRGVEDCVALVRALLARETDDFRALVGKYERADLVVSALRSQQAALAEARSWETSARAMRAIHGVEADLRFSLEQKSQFNTVIRCSTLIAEFAQTDAKSDGGWAVGRMDVEALQAKAMALIHVADTLPALISGHQTPFLSVSPSGDLRSDHTFSDTTLKATATQLHARDRSEADANYGRRRDASNATVPADADLAEALEAEYGVPHAVLREFADALGHLVIADGVYVVVRRRSALLQDLAEDEILKGSPLEPLLGRLILPWRDGWSDIPDGAVAGDFDVSKFDRRLSLIGRPIPALSGDDDPLLVIAPATIERALVHNLSGALSGDLQNQFWSSETMRRFASRQGAQTGLAFNDAVAEAVAGQALETWSGRTMSWCLDRKQTEELKRLGDIDVLAYSRAENLVWVIEAKDLKLCRTLGEVARRLADYRGALDRKNRPDALLKHLRRTTFLRDNADGLCKRLGTATPPRVCGLVVVKSPQPMTQLPGVFYDDARVALLDRLDAIPWQIGW